MGLATSKFSLCATLRSHHQRDVIFVLQGPLGSAATTESSQQPRTAAGMFAGQSTAPGSTGTQSASGAGVAGSNSSRGAVSGTSSNVGTPGSTYASQGTPSGTALDPNTFYLALPLKALCLARCWRRGRVPQIYYR